MKVTSRSISKVIYWAANGVITQRFQDVTTRETRVWNALTKEEADSKEEELMENTQYEDIAVDDANAGRWDVTAVFVTKATYAV